MKDLIAGISFLASDRAGFSDGLRTVLTLTPLPRQDSCTKSEAGEIGEKEQIAGRRKEQEQSG